MAGELRVHLSDPSAMDELLALLRDGGRAARRIGEAVCSVLPAPDSVAGQDEAELRFFLEAWTSLRSGVTATLET